MVDWIDRVQKSEGKKSQQQQSTTSTDQQSRAAIRWKYPQIELAGGVTDISQWWLFSKLCSTSQHICWLVELINNDVNLLFCLMLCFGVVSVLFLSLYNNHWYLHRHIYLNNNFCLPVDVENQFRTALLLNIFKSVSIVFNNV